MHVRPTLLVVLFTLLVSTSVFAQEATLGGTIVDGTKAALPGATITATMIDTGRATTVSDERGEYRLRGAAGRALQGAGRAVGLHDHHHSGH